MGQVEDDLAESVDNLRHEHGLAVRVADRTVCLVEPVRTDPGQSVLRVLSLVERCSSPVGVAAHGPKGVAAGAWLKPDLYVARWTDGRLWVVSYRLSTGSLPSHYVRTEGHIPTRFETGSWHVTVPAAVVEVFFGTGVDLHEPPFPVPEPVRPAFRPTPSTTSPGRRAPRSRAAPVQPGRPAAAPPVPRAKPATARVCAGCRMHKAPGQFVAGSDRCVDCR